MHLLVLLALLKYSGSAQEAYHPIFQKEIIYDTFISEGANIADVDRDGDMDILAGHYWFENPTWKTHEIRTPEVFDYTKGYSQSFLNFTMDVNQDGWQDYICFGFPGAAVHWYENPKGLDKHWEEHLIDSTACNESPMMVDLDSDGRKELVFGNMNRGEMMWYKPPTKPGSSWTGKAIGLSQKEGTQRFSHGLGWSDVNNDGIKDIIVREGWWEVPTDLDKFPWKFHKTDLGLPCSQIYTYDFDRDGDQDVLSASAHAYGIWWHEQITDQNGRTSFKRHLIDSTFSQTHGVAFADINGDDVPDFVTGKRFFAHQGKDPGGLEPAVIFWFETKHGPDGAPYWIRHTIDEDSGIGIHVVLTDINGDGRLDILNGNKKGVIVFWGK